MAVKLYKTCKQCGKIYNGIGAFFCSEECRIKSQIKPRIKRICLQCGREFEAKKKHENKKYCSINCYQPNKRKCETEICNIELECQWCHNKFFHFNKHKKFCSKECKTNEQIKRKTKKRIKNCLNCGKEFECQNYTFEKTKYCSVKCCSEHFEKLGLYSHEHEKIRFKRICLNCGKEFECQNCRKKFNPKYCSYKCRYEYINKLFNRETNCLCCGKLIKYKSHEGDRKYCNQTCYLKHAAANHSNLSKTINEFILSLGFVTEQEKFVRCDNKKFHIDILVNNKIAIECNGDYWHCNPKFYKPEYFNSKAMKTAQQIWNFDNVRNEMIRKLGYKLIMIFEDDWVHGKEFIMNKIKDFICSNL